MNIHKKKSRRVRRKKEDINKDLLSAARSEILEKGFENITVASIIKRADVQANVFYNRYKDQDDLFDVLIRPYEYWFEDKIKFLGETSIERLLNAMNSLIDSVVKDKFMQQILIWEICCDNYLTNRMALKRELYFNHYIKKHCKQDSDILDLYKISSFIIGGIYYFFIVRKNSNQIPISDINNLKKQINSIITGISHM